MDYRPQRGTQINGFDINIAQEKWSYDKDTKKYTTNYHFAYVHPCSINELESSSKKAMYLVLQNKKVPDDLKPYICLHETMKSYGRIIFDIDLSGSLVDEVYRQYPKEEKSFVPIGFTKDIENVIISVFDEINPNASNILKKDTIVWNSFEPDRKLRPFCWTHACRKGKLSFHLTLPLWCESLVGTNGCMKILYHILNDRFINHPKFYWLRGEYLFDMSLTNLYHQIRLPLQPKREDIDNSNYIHKYVDEGFSWLEAISGLPGVIVSDEFKISIPNKYIHPYDEYPNVFDYDNDIPTCNLTKEDILTMLSNSHIDIYSRGYSDIVQHNLPYPNSTGWKLHTTGIQDCPCCKREHLHTKNTPMIFMSATSFYLFCFQSSGKPGNTVKIGSRDYSTSKINYREKMEKYALSLYRPISGPIPESILINEQNIRNSNDIDRNADMLIIKSSVGTGKSEFSREIIRSHPDWRVLIISTRIAYANDIYNKHFQQLGFTLYDSESHTWFKDKRLIVQLESLHKVSIDYYDLILLDECMTVFKLFNSITMEGKVQDTWNKLNLYMKYAKQVIAMDAFITPDTVDILRWIFRHRKCQLVINQFKPGDRQPRKVYKFDDKGQFTAKLSMDTDKSFVVSSHAAYAIDIARHLISNGKKVLLQIGAQKIKKAKEKGIPDQNVQEPNKEIWSQYDIVIITPVVLNGISFEDIHFDNLYIYAARNSCDPYDVLQMSYRVRHFNEASINYFLDNRNMLSTHEPLNIRDFNNTMNSWSTSWESYDTKKKAPIVSLWNTACKDLKFIIMMSKLRDSNSSIHTDAIFDYLFQEEMGYELLPGNYHLTLKLDKKVSTGGGQSHTEDLKEFHSYVNPKWELADDIYRKKWCAGGRIRQNLIDLCNISKIEKLRDEVEILKESNLHKITLQEALLPLENEIKRLSIQRIESKMSCWKELLMAGNSKVYLNTMELSFTTSQRREKGFQDLLNRIDSLYQVNLSGRNTWQSLERWLKECVFIPTIERSDSIASSNNIEYKYKLDLSDWVGLYVS